MAVHRGPQQKTVSGLEAGRGVSPSPCSASGAAAECITPPTAPTPRSGSRQRCPSRCSVSPSRGAIDLVIMATMTRANTQREGRRLAQYPRKGGLGRGNCSTLRPAEAGEIWRGGRLRMLAFGDDRHEKSCSRRQPRASGKVGDRAYGETPSPSSQPTAGLLPSTRLGPPPSVHPRPVPRRRRAPGAPEPRRPPA